METLPTRETHEFCERCGDLVKREDIVESIYGAHCPPCHEEIESGDIEISSDQFNNDLDDDWKREQAMEAGMLHGIDAYNDAMGYSTYQPEEEW